MDRIKISEIFEDLNTTDHNNRNEERESRFHQNDAVVMRDLTTQSIQSYQCKLKKLAQKM